MNARDIRQGDFRRPTLANVREHMGVEDVLVMGRRRRLPLRANVLGHERLSNLCDRISLPVPATLLGWVVAAGDGPENLASPPTSLIGCQVLAVAPDREELFGCASSTGARPIA